MSILQIPPGTKTIELTNSIIWLNPENGYLYSRPTEGDFIHATRQQMEEDMIKFRSISGGKKMYMIAEAHPKAEQPKKEDRDFIANKLQEVVKAIAIITPNAVSRMVANLFFLFKPAPYPMKMFVSESDAKQWLRELEKNGTSKPMMFAA